MVSARELFATQSQPAAPEGLARSLADDFPRLRQYMGETRFAGLARAYAAKHAAEMPNLTWFSRHLPAFLAAARLHDHWPELAELAILERALAETRAGPAAPIVRLAELAALSHEQLGAMQLLIAPSVRRFAVASNVTSLWASLACGETPPLPIKLAARQQLLVWRQGPAPRFRMLGDEEAMGLDAAIDGKRFAAIGALLAGRYDPDGAARRATAYLRGWVDGELVTGLRPLPDRGGNTPGRRA
ncbi:MAG: putative DNA-binding domain-containing protein [Rhizobiales bacterium]|nr:putative DNA-binding domain-containing protein [Hyphomicrobiales bacterium]